MHLLRLCHEYPVIYRGVISLTYFVVQTYFKFSETTVDFVRVFLDQ